MTQLYGLPFWQKISPYWRILPAVAWITFAVSVVLASEDVPNKNIGLGLGSIPAGQWACAFAAWLILLLLRKIMPERLTTRRKGVEFWIFHSKMVRKPLLKPSSSRHCDLHHLFDIRDSFLGHAKVRR